MRFMFPQSEGYLPNEDQLRLLVGLTLDNDFPGFLHESALAVTKRDDNKNLQYQLATPEMCEVIKNHPYLYIPYDLPLTYIMTSADAVVGFIRSGNLLTYWFEKSISLHEIYTATHYKIPIVCKFTHLGRSESCTLCHAQGALDWVDEVKALGKYRPVPRKRYVIANHRYYNFLIDNKYVLEYEGEHFVHPCPKCMGLGCNSVLHLLNNKIEGMNFGANPMYHLLLRGARETFIDMPYPFT